ncbi:unnamed protein product [Closterium sp. Naga37s-1]|nr:unnamed protein product [Closterium sp. Naga37s-1]
MGWLPGGNATTPRDTFHQLSPSAKPSAHSASAHVISSFRCTLPAIVLGALLFGNLLLFSANPRLWPACPPDRDAVDALVLAGLQPRGASGGGGGGGATGGRALQPSVSLVVERPANDAGAAGGESGAAGEATEWWRKKDSAYSPTGGKGGGGTPPLAYGILSAKNDSARAARLLLAIYHPLNHYAARVDIDDPEETLALKTKIAAHPALSRRANIVVIPDPEVVTYQGSTLLSATLRLAHVHIASGVQWDWFINLSAADYPLMSQDDALSRPLLHISPPHPPHPPHPTHRTHPPQPPSPPSPPSLRNPLTSPSPPNSLSLSSPRSNPLIPLTLLTISHLTLTPSSPDMLYLFPLLLIPSACAQTCSISSRTWIAASLSWTQRRAPIRVSRRLASYDYRQRAVNLDRELFLPQPPTLPTLSPHPYPLNFLLACYRAVKQDRAHREHTLPILLPPLPHNSPLTPLLPPPAPPTLIPHPYPFSALLSSYRQRAVNLDRALFQAHRGHKLFYSLRNPPSFLPPYVPSPTSYRQRAVNLDRALFQAHRGHKLMWDVRPAATRFHVFMVGSAYSPSFPIHTSTLRSLQLDQGVLRPSQAAMSALTVNLSSRLAPIASYWLVIPLPSPSLPSPPLPSPPLHSAPLHSTPLLSPPLPSPHSALQAATDGPPPLPILPHSVCFVLTCHLFHAPFTFLLLQLDQGIVSLFALRPMGARHLNPPLLPQKPTTRPSSTNSYGSPPLKSSSSPSTPLTPLQAATGSRRLVPSCDTSYGSPSSPLYGSSPPAPYMPCPIPPRPPHRTRSRLQLDQGVAPLPARRFMVAHQLNSRLYLSPLHSVA